MKVILDEVFGEHKFRNEIVWKRSNAHSDGATGASHYGRVYDTVLFYVRSDQTKSKSRSQHLCRSQPVTKWYRHVEDGNRTALQTWNVASGPGGAQESVNP